LTDHPPTKKKEGFNFSKGKGYWEGWPFVIAIQYLGPPNYQTLCGGRGTPQALQIVLIEGGASSIKMN